MSRTLLLCFVHGFKGTDDTFHDFPSDLKRAVTKLLPEQRVESVVYPKYETKGELAQATDAFLEWLKERVMEVRKTHSEKPWPPNDRDVGVILVAHSMGGFVAADALFLAVNERAANPNDNDLIFPLIQGILTFDTPYNGLARSMFVYGAFSNYQKVSNVFNAMAALGAAAPAGLARLSSVGARTAATRTAATARSSQWKAWQLVAVKTGTVGAIAAGGVTAYIHREAIIKGMRSVKNINKESVVESYRQGMDALGQGLAYINRGNVGKSFEWLSDHFTFVGALLKQRELNRRLERMGALKGVGIHDFYCSLGENGYWSGGYFVPERTFCAIPEETHDAYPLFSRRVMPKATDEIEAHLNMFRPEKHAGYEDMTEKAAVLVHEWFLGDEQIIDDLRFAEVQPEEGMEDKTVAEVLENGQGKIDDLETEEVTENEPETGDHHLPDESPVDIAAAASLVPLPNDEGDLIGDASTDSADSEQKRTYMQHLFRVAQQAGTGISEAKGWLPSSMSRMPNMPSMPAMPKVPASVSSLGQISMPGASLFSKKEVTVEGEGETTNKTAAENVSAAEGQNESLDMEKTNEGKES
ncbi:Fc.00g041700.m01.CDS01 [Cosmosporella sp. VM-42]